MAVEYQNIKFNKHNVHFLKLDPKKEKIRLIKALGGKIGTENLLDIVDRHNAIAGINAGYFEARGKMNGIPSGVMKIDDNVFLSRDKYQLMVMDRDDLFFTISDVRPYLIMDKEIPIDAINKPQKGIVVYTPSYWDHTLTR